MKLTMGKTIMNRQAFCIRGGRLRLLPILLSVLAGGFALPAGAAAQTSPHGPIRFECLTCHTPESWTMRSNGSFKHEETGFPLLQQHANVRCASCHNGLKFKKTTSGCIACHTDVHKSEMGNNCLSCHSQQSWHIPDMLQRHQSTRFPLLGMHGMVACQECHANAGRKQYAGTPTNCYGCHAEAFAATSSPAHAAAGFSTDCSRCHQVTGMQWGGGFAHQSSRFPLTGAHTTLPCTQCHVNNNYQLHYTDCYACHAIDFATSANLNHVEGNFSHTCDQCHGTAVWKPATFSHSATSFQLTGAHRTATCTQCHVNGNYQLKYTDCYACHGAEFAKPTNPNHVAGSFSHTCNSCHTTTVWTPSTFSHMTTAFPLVGAHQAVACNQCHSSNVYKGLPHGSCWDCHSGTFNATLNPNHATGGFSHDCTICHSQSAWQPATFAHSSTKFPLTGAHIALACTQCHVNGNYTLSYQNCYQCHSSDYSAVANPSHVSQLFPKDCTGCHSTSVWTPNTMKHDVAYFRIYSGKHRGRWTQCSQCHTSLGSLGAYNCTTACHRSAHNNGQDCYSCHRNV